MIHKFKQGYLADILYQTKLIFFRPTAFKDALPSGYSRKDIRFHIAYLQPAVVFVILSALLAFSASIRAMESAGWILHLSKSPISWLGVARVIGGEIAVTVAAGTLIGITGGVSLGIAFGIAGGIFWGFGLGIAGGIIGKVVIGLVLGIALGEVFGISKGIILGIILGVGLGLTRGVAMGAAFITGLTRLWYLPYFLLQYPLTRLMPDKTLDILKKSPLHFDELIGYPLPFLFSTLSRIIDRDRKAGIEEVKYIMDNRPLQRKAAHEALGYMDARKCTIIPRSLSDFDKLKNIIEDPLVESGKFPKTYTQAIMHMRGICKKTNNFLNQENLKKRQKTHAQVTALIKNFQNEMKQIKKDKYAFWFQQVANYWLTLAEPG